MNKVCVLGSINMDLVINVQDMPKIGETILSKNFKKVSGGKGANQAVAASRFGCVVSMIGKIGLDDNGQILKNILEKDKINTDSIFEDKKSPTGMAIITVDEKSNNSIIVIPGSNMELNEEDIELSKEEILRSNILISQFETPQNITIKAFKIAKDNNKVTILNPAPAQKINKELLKLTDIIIPNELEVQALTGIKVNSLEDAKIAGKSLLKDGVKFVIITLGEKGAAIISNREAKLIDGVKVTAIDTTAAGDSFIGALCSKITVNNLTFDNLVEAVSFANNVAAVTVQRQGAQPSIPTIEEMEYYMKKDKINKYNANIY